MISKRGLIVVCGVMLAVLGGSSYTLACNDYCVDCGPRGRKQVNNCPGGEVGRIIVGVQNSGCQITYYDPRYCKESTTMASRAPTTAELEQSEKKIEQMLKEVQVLMKAQP